MMLLGSMSYYQYVCLFVELFAVTHKSLICDVNRLVCVFGWHLQHHSVIFVSRIISCLSIYLTGTEIRIILEEF